MKKLFLIFLILNLNNWGYSQGKKALLVGIADYRNLPSNYRIQERDVSVEDLRGPIEDIRMAKSFLERIGFRDEDVKILENRNAKRDDILREIDEWLINSTRQGDIVFFYFTGHGTQVPDLNGDERDSMDEALCAWDLVPVGAHSIERAGLILDDELGQKFRNLTGRRVIAIIDSCHAESTTTRGLESKKVNTLKKRYVPIELNIDNRRGIRLREIPVAPDIPEGQIFFFSSKEDQISFELLFNDNRYHGVFSYSFFQNIQNNQNLSIRRIFERIRNFMNENAGKAYTLFQTPVLIPENNPLLDQSFVNVLSISGTNQQANQQVSQEDVSVSNRDDRLLVKFESNSLRRQFNNMNFITISNNEYFDRFIKGGCRGERCNIEVLNRLGDSISANSIEESKRILRYAYLAKLFLNLEDIKNNFEVKLEPKKEIKYDYRIGENLVLKFYTERDCNLFLVYLDSQGNFDILFPNRFERNNFIQANTTIYIPSENQNFDLQITEPVGEDTIKAVCVRNNDLRGIRIIQRENTQIFYEVDNFENFYSSLRNNVLSQDAIVIRTYR